jgi:hypothetical protein
LSSSEYVIPHALIALVLRKHAKTQQNQSKSHGVDLVFSCFSIGFMVFWWGYYSEVMFLLERPLTREYPKQVLDTSKTVKNP